ncbi:hypothetical protein RJP21_27635 [Paenibacillus sp. VCA1]|uniref:hypothetical protein n=1 Tax=Paenibacillus sp. VCA1 TaxID=3039148 RepID=UPI002870B730|nr:hypothetical protein [Paenibacillus sp. VCA1]MDR9857370.1 hypothetical protein [Paenibacillus sp. VCA1]
MKEQAVQKGIPEDIGIVLLTEMGDYLFKWLEASVPALDHARLSISWFESKRKEDNRMPLCVFFFSLRF